MFSLTVKDWHENNCSLFAKLLLVVSGGRIPIPGMLIRQIPALFPCIGYSWMLPIPAIDTLSKSPSPVVCSLLSVIVHQKYSRVITLTSCWISECWTETMRPSTVQSNVLWCQFGLWNEWFRIELIPMGNDILKDDQILTAATESIGVKVRGATLSSKRPNVQYSCRVQSFHLNEMTSMQNAK